MHHIVSDGVSSALMINELVTAYIAYLEGIQVYQYSSINMLTLLYGNAIF